LPKDGTTSAKCRWEPYKKFRDNTVKLSASFKATSLCLLFAPLACKEEKGKGHGHTLPEGARLCGGLAFAEKKDLIIFEPDLRKRSKSPDQFR